jgi:hypothetical protein
MSIEGNTGTKSGSSPCGNYSGSGSARVLAFAKEVAATFTASDRHRLIAQVAFDRASLRGFAPGHEVEDWLIAERAFEAAGCLIEPAPRWDPA